LDYFLKNQHFSMVDTISQNHFHPIDGNWHTFAHTTPNHDWHWLCFGPASHPHMNIVANKKQNKV
jgi:hypothetical protein